MAIYQLFHKLYALVFEELRMLLDAAIQRHAHLPGARKHFRIFDRDVVLKDIAADGRVAFDDVERVTVKIAGAIEPCLAVERVDIDHEGVSLPWSARPAHPCVGG